VYKGASLGNVKESSLESIFRRFYEVSARLKKIRVELYSKGDVSLKMNTCDFCNKYLSKMKEKDI
jgi:hypothetical protein